MCFGPLPVPGVDDRPEGRSVSVPSAVGEVGGGEDSDTCLLYTSDAADE